MNTHVKTSSCKLLFTTCHTYNGMVFFPHATIGIFIKSVITGEQQNMLRLALMLTIVFWANTATAQVTIPDCPVLKNWAATVALPADYKDTAQAEAAKKTVAAILTDEKTAPVFGAPRSQWGERDIKEVKYQLNYCQQTLLHMRDREASLKVGYVHSTMDQIK